MARLIQKSGYIQGGRAARYMEYVAKRDGVEVLQSTEPVTKKQMQFLTKLLKDFPDAKELFEYSDYLQTPNRGTASAFIVAALDTHLHELESESGYMAYIANRPRVEKHGGHGLFSTADVTDLKAAKNELETHAGKVWTFIFSLRREDAERLGYSKAAAWQNLLKQESHSIAEAMRIPPEKFRWYAAYHDEGHHPHIHMMAWSDDPKVGFLTQKGIASIRSKMTNEIFRDEMTELYIRKDAAYKESMPADRNYSSASTGPTERRIVSLHRYLLPRREAPIRQWDFTMRTQRHELLWKHLCGSGTIPSGQDGLYVPQGPLQRRQCLLAQRPQDRGGLEAVPPHRAAGIK